MTTEPTKLIIDCTTGEETVLPLTEEEIAEAEKLAEETKTRLAVEQAEADAKAEAKASALAKLTALGLTEDEATALAG
jgi:hypothetical protein